MNGMALAAVGIVSLAMIIIAGMICNTVDRRTKAISERDTRDTSTRSFR